MQELKENVRQVFGDYVTEDFEDWSYLGDYGIYDVDMGRPVLKVQGTDVEFDAKVEMQKRDSKDRNMFTITWRLVINDDGWEKGVWKVCSIKPFEN